MARPARILFSAYGLREGHLFDVLLAGRKGARSADRRLPGAGAARWPLRRHRRAAGRLDRAAVQGRRRQARAPAPRRLHAQRHRLARASGLPRRAGVPRASSTCRSAASTMTGASPLPTRSSSATAATSRRPHMSELLTLLGDDDRDYWQRVGLGAAAGLFGERGDAGRTQGNRRPHGRCQDPPAAAEGPGGPVRRKRRAPVQRARPGLRTRCGSFDRSLMPRVNAARSRG